MQINIIKRVFTKNVIFLCIGLQYFLDGLQRKCVL